MSLRPIGRFQYEVKSLIEGFLHAPDGQTQLLRPDSFHGQCPAFVWRYFRDDVHALMKSSSNCAGVYRAREGKRT